MLNNFEKDIKKNFKITRSLSGIYMYLMIPLHVSDCSLHSSTLEGEP